MSHVDPKRPTVMPAYPLGSPPGAETAQPWEDPQDVHVAPARPPRSAASAKAQPERRSDRSRPDDDEEWTVQADADPTHPIHRR